MRLWTLHPKHLDARGLVAVWREGLLAQAVLRGRTVGYRSHPQLDRFRAQPSPVGSVADYLRAIHAEAARRGYRFDFAKIARARGAGPIAAKRGQMRLEWDHLMAKLERRDPAWRARQAQVSRPRAHPVFRVVAGAAESWEKARPTRRAGK